MNNNTGTCGIQECDTNIIIICNKGCIKVPENCTFLVRTVDSNPVVKVNSYNVFKQVRRRLVERKRGLKCLRCYCKREEHPTSGKMQENIVQQSLENFNHPGGDYESSNSRQSGGSDNTSRKTAC